MSEKARYVGLNPFFGRKKCGNLNFVIFYVGKSAESWTLSFLLAEKAQKVELVLFNGGKRCGKLDFVILDGGKVWKIDFAIFYG
jgi:hypothetical protein